MSKQETKFEFCTHEQHGGVCKPTGEYCSLGPCPNEDIKEFVPVRHGRWVHEGPRFRGGVDWWHCSNCGSLASGVEMKFRYCSHCGARMGGAE